MWMDRFLQLVVLMCMSLAIVPRAGATTLAILPLERGAGSTTYDGLGAALAGMLVADLAPVQGLTLVERARMDAVLSELGLAEQGWLDPATAQRIGAGLGAELVLVGSWSVVDTRFLLDARLVEVESGAVRKAAASEGTTDDFVSVEKELVAQLVAGLPVTLSAAERRRLWSTTPTERFEAFVAYGAGQHAASRDAWEEAAAAYARALEADPDFTGAREALSSIRATVEAGRARTAAAAEAALAPVFSRILTDVPDERTRPRGFVHEPASRAAFALRAMVLENTDKPCQRFEEMLAYAEHVAWDVALGDDGVRAFRALVTSTGFAAVPSDVPAPPAAYRSPSGRLSVFEHTSLYLLDREFFTRARDGSGLGATLLACYPREEQAAAFERVRRSLRATPAANSKDRRDDVDAATLWDLLATYERVVHFGLDRPTEQRLAALLEAQPDAEARADIQHPLDVILAAAGRWEDSQIRRHGRPTDVLERVMRAVASGDAAVLDVSHPTCATLATTMRPAAASWLARLPTVRDDVQLAGMAWDTAGRDFAILATPGCVRGVPGRFADAEALASFLRVGVGQLRAEAQDEHRCHGAVAALEPFLQPDALERAKASPDGEAMWTYGVLIQWYGMLHYQRCVDDRVP